MLPGVAALETSLRAAGDNSRSLSEVLGVAPNLCLSNAGLEIERTKKMGAEHECPYVHAIRLCLSIIS